MDPFCGSGTTLVEAQRLMRRSVGVDINPISVLISKAKTLSISSVEIEATLDRILTDFTSRSVVINTDAPLPPLVQASKWYSGSVLPDLKRLFHLIARYDDPCVRLIGEFCFSAILLGVSRETRHWGYVCDNTSPKGDPKRSVSEALFELTRSLLAAYRERDRAIAGSIPFDSLVIQGRSQALTDYVGADAVDLIVTSPPYFGVVDYVKSQRLSMEWFGHDIEQHRIQEIGARSKRHRRLAVDEFEADLRNTFQSMYVCLKAGAPCAVVFGASKSRTFNSDDIVAIAESVGFCLAGEVERQISVQRRQNPSLTTEQVYLFCKPSYDSLG